jgi:diguanylate cyclase (GGDEF)-like protein/PAS domain S-box-containing protein
MTQDNRPAILVVDDEPVICAIAQSVLDEHDFTVSVAGSGEEAMALIQQGYVPDLVLLDVLMPGINGFQVCRQLRRDQRFEHLPIIMLTGLDDQPSIDEAYACGATDFITKPVNIPLLPHRIRYLLRSAAAFRALFDNQVALINTQEIARLGNWRMDGNNDIVSASLAYLDIVGETTLPLPEKHFADSIHPEDRERFLGRRRQLTHGQSYQMDYRLRQPRGTSGWINVHERGYPQFDGRGTYLGASGYTQDINERVSREERIRDLAWNDQLTGLHNRTRLLELLDEETETAGAACRLTLLFVHLAGMAQWSTVLGQEAADDIILTTARRLKSFCDSLNASASHGAAKLARHDETSFVAVLSGNSHTSNVLPIAELLLGAVTQPMTVRGETLLPIIRIGITSYPEDAGAPSELIRRAMLVALQGTEKSGSGINLFDPEHDREASQRMQLEHDLRTAIARGGQLVPYFQPKISRTDGSMKGAEVLLRWQHPELGLVPPVRFIPLAEDSGLIHPISEWLFSEVCERMAGWLREGRNIGNISINLSADSFFKPELLRHIDAVLERTGIPAHLLTIELTESVLLQDSEIARQVIDALRTRGMRVSLDDFGTGFSSLGYLNRFSIDEIKIDRSFVVDLETDNRERALVQAIISLGHALAIEVVAEGVETTTQASILGEMGCDTLQGYLFAKPMPADDFMAFSATMKSNVKNEGHAP